MTVTVTQHSPRRKWQRDVTHSSLPYRSGCSVGGACGDPALAVTRTGSDSARGHRRHRERLLGPAAATATVPTTATVPATAAAMALSDADVQKQVWPWAPALAEPPKGRGERG